MTPIVSFVAYRYWYSNSESNIFASLISSKTTSHYNINQVATNFGRKICQALPFFYSFTGCDTVSAFFNQGKCKFWDRWEEFHGHDELTNCFIELSCMPETLSFANVDIIEKYVLFVYYGNIGNSVNINEKRMNDFEHSTHSNLRLLPPSRLGRIEHIKRAAFAAGWIGYQCVKDIALPDPSEWGWIDQGGYRPVW